jgi:hypothetical protein
MLGSQAKAMGPLTLSAAIGAAAVGGRVAAGAVSEGLSFATELLRGASGAEASADEVAGEPNRSAGLLQRIAALADRIRQQLAAAGIGLSQPVELVSDGLGGIALAGPHPQQAAIEDLLASDVLLQRDFNNLRREHEALRAEPECCGLPATFSVMVAND